jgi:hypothetical protein
VPGLLQAVFLIAKVKYLSGRVYLKTCKITLNADSGKNKYKQIMHAIYMNSQVKSTFCIWLDKWF